MNVFMNCIEAFESICLKINLGRIKVNVYEGITKEGLSKSKVYCYAM